MRVPGELKVDAELTAVRLRTLRPVLQQNAELAVRRRGERLPDVGGHVAELAGGRVVVHAAHGQQLALLHCVLEYPTPLEHANLLKIRSLRNQFPELIVGYSDHTKPTESNDVIKTAYNLGAQLVEKHFTLDRNMEGPDHKASLEPDELKAMVSAIRNIEQAVGDGIKKVTDSEKGNIAVARKSIVASRNIKKGEILSEDNLTVKRPGTGISPMRWEEVLGQIAKRDFSEEELIEL